MDKTVKQLKKIFLPIRVGERVKFSTEEGQLCESTPVSIDRISLEKSVMRISFSTKNTVYKDGEVKLKYPAQSQVIMPGVMVSMGGNDLEHVDIIYEVNKSGICIGSTSRTWLFGEIEAIE